MTDATLDLASVDLTAIPDDELRRAYLATDGEPGDPLADALAKECERRGIDL